MSETIPADKIMQDERLLLSYCLKQIGGTQLVSADTFSIPAHKTIIAAYILLEAQHVPPTVDAIADLLTGQDALEGVGGREYLDSLLLPRRTPQSDAMGFAWEPEELHSMTLDQARRIIADQREAGEGQMTNEDPSTIEYARNLIAGTVGG